MINIQILRNCQLKITLSLYDIIIFIHSQLKLTKQITAYVGPEIINDIFKLRGNPHYNLRDTSQFLVDPIQSVFIGSESASYLGRKIWEEIPTDAKNKDSLIGFKKEIKKWKPLNCPCRICKTFIPDLGFIQFIIFIRN